MSERSRDLPRRSCLSVPGSSEKMLAKGPTLPADMTFLDLEDAVSPLEKEAARPKVVDAIRDQDWGDRVMCVRVNAWDTEWTTFDVIEVVGNAGERLDEVMLPKVQSAAEVIALDLLLTQVEQKAGLPRGHIGIEAQIETARGIINVEEICAASPRLETIILGPVDMSASMEMPSLAGGLQIPEYPGDYFHYVFVKILMAGRANGLQVIDGPYVKVRDSEGFRDYCTRTQVLGFDGKWALHPDQITILNEVFSPTQEQFDKAWDVLDAYEKATTEGDRKGAVMFGDEMIDEASRKVAVKLVAKGKRAGMARQQGLSISQRGTQSDVVPIQPPPTIDVVMAARDESETVAGNVAAARGCACVREVIVVDDGSSDDTADRARAAGAKVIVREDSDGSKAHAMADGVAATDAEAILFVDADLIGLTSQHLDEICRPFLEARATMSVGAFDYGWFWNPQVRRWPPLSGERIIPRWVWEAIPDDKLDGYTIEIRINEVIAERRLRTSVRTMDGVYHRTKRVKHGRIEGIKRTWDMYRELVSQVWPLGDVRPRTYWFYLRYLRVER